MFQNIACYILLYSEYSMLYSEYSMLPYAASLLAGKRRFASFCHVNHNFTSTFHHKFVTSGFGSRLFRQPDNAVCVLSTALAKMFIGYFLFCPPKNKACLRKYLREHDRLIIEPGMHTAYQQSKILVNIWTMWHQTPNNAKQAGSNIPIDNCDFMNIKIVRGKK